MKNAPALLPLLLALALPARAAQVEAAPRAAVPPLFAAPSPSWTAAFSSLSRDLRAPSAQPLLEAAPMLGFLKEAEASTPRGAAALAPLAAELERKRPTLAAELLLFDRLPLARRWAVLKDLSEAHNDASFAVRDKAAHAAEVAALLDDPALLAQIEDQLKALAPYGEAADAAARLVGERRSAAVLEKAERTAEALAPERREGFALPEGAAPARLAPREPAGGAAPERPVAAWPAGSMTEAEPEEEPFTRGELRFMSALFAVLAGLLGSIGVYLVPSALSGNLASVFAGLSAGALAAFMAAASVSWWRWSRRSPR